MRISIPVGSEEERLMRLGAHLYAIEKDGARGTSVSAFLSALIKNESEARRALKKAKNM